MKNIKKIVFALLISLILPIINVYATDGLSIDDKSYNENTQVFTVSGTSEYNDVMVTLFDGEELLSFKTVQTENDHYTATFKISFDADKTITIKVGDINSTEYKMSTLDVKKTEQTQPQKTNIITDSADNSLTSLNDSNKFNLDDELDIQIITDFTNLENNDKETIKLIQKKLGSKKQVIGIMIVSVLNGDNEINLDETNLGYKLFLKVDKNDYDSYNKPYMARVLDLDNVTLEKGLEIKYDSKSKGMVTKINNIGIYILYDDINYKKVKNPKTGDDVLKHIITLSVSTIALAGIIFISIRNKKRT